MHFHQHGEVTKEEIERIVRNWEESSMDRLRRGNPDFNKMFGDLFTEIFGKDILVQKEEKQNPEQEFLDVIRKIENKVHQKNIELWKERGDPTPWPSQRMIPLIQTQEELDGYFIGVENEIKVIDFAIAEIKNEKLRAEKRIVEMTSAATKFLEGLQ